MNYSSGYYCLLVICGCYQMCMGNPFAIAFAVGEKAVALYNGVQKARQFFKPSEFEATNNQLYNEMKELRTDFSNFKSELMQKVSQDLKSRLKDAADEFFKHVKNIDNQYGLFLEYSGAPIGKYENSTLHEFANNAVTSSLVELSREIGKMQESFIDQDIEGHNVISIIARNSTASDLMCVKHESKQQMINDLHQVFIKSNMKGLMVKLYSFELKAKFENKKYQGERELAIEMFTNSTNIVSHHVKSALKLSSREVWSCDPREYRRGDTFDKLQEVFQAYVVTESDTKRLSDYGNDFFSTIAQAAALDINKCHDMKDERLNCHTPICRAQPQNKLCTGHLRDCQDMPSSQICHASDHSDRRYDWLRTDIGNDFAHWGRNRFYSNCANTQGIVQGGGRIDTCVCTCEHEHILDDRHFSLLDVLSDVGDNKVVTGVRLAKEYHVFQIQIEQGTLGPNGTIIDEPKWKNVKSFSRDDLYDPKVAVPKMSRHWNPDYEYEEWVDFRKNNVVYSVKYGRNNVYLDTLDADPHRVVTGLRFQHQGESLKLEIQTMPFDYASGKLKPSAFSWKSNNNERKNRKELRLNKPDDPTKVNGPNKFLSTDNQFIDFRMTDFDLDFGQYTVPFLDLQSVTTTPRMPLSGAGLVLRGQDNSGGFLALKVIHYDYTNHF